MHQYNYGKIFIPSKLILVFLFSVLIFGLNTKNVSAACKIQGYKLMNITQGEPFNSIPVTLKGGSSVTTNPYYLYPTTSSFSVNVPTPPLGYDVGYTMCNNSTSCHNTTPIKSTTATGTCDSGYVDLWWHYSLKTDWTDTGTAFPVFFKSLPTESNPPDGNMYAPEIMYDNGKYFLWYGGQSATYPYYDSIHYATSLDGLNWTKGGMIIDGPSEGGQHANDPSVVKVNGIYYMYYSLSSSTIRCQIRLATSTDGKNFTRQGTVLAPDPTDWTNYEICRPSVLYEDNTFKLWFDAMAKGYPETDANMYVGYATSTDGKNFNRLPNYVLGNIAAIDVKKYKGTYFMAIQGITGNSLATSPDGISWTKRGQFTTIDGTIDAYGRATPFLFFDKDGIYRGMYFGAARASTWSQLIIAIEKMDSNSLDKYLPTPSPSPSPTPDLTPSPSPSATPIPIPGDANHDGSVNIMDFTLLSNSFGLSDLDQNYDPNCDFDNNKRIDVLDFTILSNNFGRSI